MSAKLQAIALVALAGMFAAACGGGGDDGTARPTSGRSATSTATREASESPSPSIAPGLVPLIDQQAILSPVELFIADAVGGGSSLRFRGESLSMATAWSPASQDLAVGLGSYDGLTGRLVLFSGEEDAGPESFDLPGAADIPVWSPDGDTVAIVSRMTGGDASLHLIRDGRLVELDRVAGDSYATFIHIAGWLPDDRLLVASGASGPGELFVYDFESDERTLFAPIAVGFPSAVSVSPDGTLVALTGLSQSGSCTGGADTIWVMATDGSVVKQHTVTGTCDVFPPVWSPDGRQIAYGVYGDDEAEGLWILDLDAGGASRLTQAIDAPQAWPAGDVILAQRHPCYGCDGTPSPVSINTAGDALVLANGSGQFSQDGQYVASAGSTGVKMARPDGSDARQVAEPEAGRDFSGASVSADNSLVAYVRWHSVGLRTYEVSADGSGFRELGYYPPNTSPSPDGSRVATVEYDESSPTGSHSDVYLADPDGSNKVRIELPYESNLAASWSPDGTRLIASSRQAFDGPQGRFLVGSDGTVIRELTELGAGYFGTLWSPDSRLLAAYDSGLLVIDPETGESWSIVGGWVYSVRWNADSESLAFAASDSYLGTRQTYTADYDGTNLQSLASTVGESIGISISPDGSLAVVSRFVGEEPQTWIVNPRTGENIREIEPLTADSAAWSPDGTRFAIKGWAPSSDGLYVVDAGTGAVEQIAWGGDPTNMRWSDGDTITFESFQGGL